MKGLDEIGLIRRLTRGMPAGRDVEVGIGDDAAVLRWPGSSRRMVWTVDMLLDGVHFFVRTHPPRAIGWKALAVSLSDMAAMGAVPKWALVSVGTPRSIPVKTLDGIYAGMRRAARRFGVGIVGGDTNRADRLVLDVTVIGEAAAGRLPLRSGAKAGDLIAVTGRLGNSYASGKHLRFVPRVAEAQRLMRAVRPHAMIDVTDGLALDVSRVASASGVGVLLEADRIPLAAGASLAQALQDGEDFELLFTCAASKRRALAALELGVPVSVIGRVTTAREGLRIRQRDGRVVSLKPKGYQHF